MYNIYKYKEEVRMQEAKRANEQSYTKWLVKHEDLKSQASQKMKVKLEQFLVNEQEQPSVLQDDHYQTWRYLKQFRDVEDQKKFIGFKAFRHKPCKQMDKYFTERQRKQTKYLAEKSKQLVKSERIPHQHISRSLRSQGPLNPKHTFRSIKQDKEYLQPRMRYTNITDQERMNESAISYDDKLKNVYTSFHLTKSKIGMPKKSPMKIQQGNNFDMIQSTYSDLDKGEKYYYEAPLNRQQKTIEIERRSPTIDLQNKGKKRYFKTAKTMSLFGHSKAKKLMLSSQYDRKKDLTNLSNNIRNQSYVKRPVL